MYALCLFSAYYYLTILPFQTIFFLSRIQTRTSRVHADPPTSYPRSSPPSPKRRPPRSSTRCAGWSARPVWCTRCSRRACTALCCSSRYLGRAKREASRGRVLMLVVMVMEGLRRTKRMLFFDCPRESEGLGRRGMGWEEAEQRRFSSSPIRLDATRLDPSRPTLYDYPSLRASGLPADGPRRPTALFAGCSRLAHSPPCCIRISLPPGLLLHPHMPIDPSLCLHPHQLQASIERTEQEDQEETLNTQRSFQKRRRSHE